VEKIFAALAVLAGSVTSIEGMKVVWSQASKAATAVSGTKLDSFFRHIYFWRRSAISPRNFSLPAVAVRPGHDVKLHPHRVMSRA